MFKRVNAALWTSCLAVAMACGSSGSGSSSGGATGKTTSPFGSIATGTVGSQSTGSQTGSGTLGGSSGGTLSSSTTGTSSGGIPSPGPGDNVDEAFDSVAGVPNGTPSEATPLGTAMTGDVSTWVDGNTIGGSTPSNYFVFETGPSAGTFSLGFGGFCWSGGVTQLTATLWQVSNAQEVQPPIHTWVGTPGSDGCLSSMAGDAPTMASTVYLLGVTATGDSGSYAA